MCRCTGIVRNGVRTGERCHLLALPGYDVCKYHTPPCQVVHEQRGIKTRCLKPTIAGTEHCYLHTPREYATRGCGC